MKKCPYCAEEIQDEAILCRYCGQKLVLEQFPVVSKQVKKDPSEGISCLLGLGLAVVVIGGAILLAWTWTGSETDFQVVLGMYQIAVMLVMTFWAVPGLNPEKRGVLRYIGVFILSIVPLMGWVVLYWAGKGLARSLRQK